MKSRIILLILAVTMSGSMAFTRPAFAVAPGCTTSQPTWLGGTFRGSDGRAINAHIGVGIKDKNGIDLLPDGSPRGGGEGYGFIERLNPDIPATGSTDPDPKLRIWGECVTNKAVSAFIEIYPKRPLVPEDAGIQQTDYSRYGLGSYYFLTITPGTKMDVLLRTPLIYQQGGNTGGVQGYITKGGHPLPLMDVKRVRAFTQQRGEDCGIEDMAAIANRLATGSSGATYYLVDYLAAGQCGAAYQAYTLRVTCGAPACGSNDVLFLRTIRVVRGKWPRVDVTF